ncbi:S28 family serine protease [Streptomyces jumonjinensis]|uniref:Aminopeptidase n=1 Tax=Streptomyces jumonjinensis TaxID=1945 RepID=A0A646KFU1_STRJU|nr:S28 family serine protease [Streptomyces jumonjinensis]MQT01103.1 aminopeptidase [Streptomyces jumonjinensis]
MRKTLTGFISLALLMGTVSAAGAVTAAAPAAPATAARGAEADIRDRLLAIPGMRLISEEPSEGHRFFTLGYTQPVDHRDPGGAVFEQRFTLLHKSTSRPTVFHTSGYELGTYPGRTEPTRIIDGNEVDLEHRYFGSSRPEPADWSKLTIRQAADDQHRLFTTLKKIYPRKWIATGNSKGGMTATYYERFHPRDMDAVVAYVAPNDVNNAEDSAYDRFFTQVGTEECRGRLRAIEREALIRRDAMTARLAGEAAAQGLTFDAFGSLDQAYEAAVRDVSWGHWQRARTPCAELPDAPSLTDQELYEALGRLSAPAAYADQALGDFAYYYQAGTELGMPRLSTPAHLRGLVRHPYQSPRSYVPRDIPMTFKQETVRDVDRWVRDHASRMLFVNGEWDPWSAEPFRPGRGAKDSHVLTAPRGDHWSHIEHLGGRDRAFATAKVLTWAGVAPAAVRKDPSKARPLAAYDSTLDRPERGGADRPAAGPIRP